MKFGDLHYGGNPWAIRPDVLSRVVAVMRGRGISADRSPTTADLEAVSDDAGDGGGGVAVIPLHGLITPRPSIISLLFGGGGGLEAFRANLRAALASKDVSSILLDVDSPGGSTDLVAETAVEVREARDVKPITAVANTEAASAAYWIASQANELVVTPSAHAIGSIGVFLVHEDWSGANEKMGVDPTYISAGKFKTEANLDEPLSEEGREELQNIVDAVYDLFVEDVAVGRGVPVQSVRSGYAEGGVVPAVDAVRMGMADSIGTFEETLAAMAAGPEPKGEPSSNGATGHTQVVVTGTAPAWLGATSAYGTTTTTQTTSAVPAAPEDQPDDKPEPKEETSEEAKARIGRLVSAKPSIHLPEKE